MIANWTLCDSAKAFGDLFNGLKEIRGPQDNPAIVAMHQWFAPWVEDDETAWCGSFAGTILRLNGLKTPGPRDWHALRARYYLTLGAPIPLESADGNCLLIFKRGGEGQPGPSELNAPGHVGFFDGMKDERYVQCYGGNQRNHVNTSLYDRERLLGVRRMRVEPIQSTRGHTLGWNEALLEIAKAAQGMQK